MVEMVVEMAVEMFTVKTLLKTMIHSRSGAGEAFGLIGNRWR